MAGIDNSKSGERIKKVYVNGVSAIPYRHLSNGKHLIYLKEIIILLLIFTSASLINAGYLLSNGIKVLKSVMPAFLAGQKLRLYGLVDQ